MARLSNSVIALSKKTLPDAAHPPGMLGKLGAKTVVAGTLRAVQLLAKQFVLGQTIEEALAESKSQRAARATCVLASTCSAKAHGRWPTRIGTSPVTMHAIEQIAAAKSASPNDGPEASDGISIKLSALHPRYEDAQHATRDDGTCATRLAALRTRGGRENQPDD
jgi:RHH-type proline utilization regulon transcriptional repressor/proline dehydrogenase/delta 1-pyrroline-5-carboxylate dehydrogenase